MVGAHVDVYEWALGRIPTHSIHVGFVNLLNFQVVPHQQGFLMTFQLVKVINRASPKGHDLSPI